LQPFPQLAIFRGPWSKREDDEARVEMNSSRALAGTALGARSPPPLVGGMRCRFERLLQDVECR
jgi:hypothetical protein